MKCRALYSEENHNIVFFKSKGLTLPSQFRIIYGDTKSIFTPEEGYSNDDIVVKYYEDTKNLLVSSETTQTIELAFYNELKKVYIPFFNSEISPLTTEIPFKKFAVSIKADDNYANTQLGATYDLVQRLSIIKNELWWNINYGLPILDKNRDKMIFDSVIINIVLRHPDVTNIESFTSKVVKAEEGKRKYIYKIYMVINTIFKENIILSNEIGS